MSFNCAFCSSGRIPAEQEPCEKAQATDHFNRIITKSSIWMSHFVALLPLQMLVFKMSMLHLDYKGREFWDKTRVLGKQNKRVIYLSDWDHLLCSCCYEKHSSHQVFSWDYPQGEKSGSHGAKKSKHPSSIKTTLAEACWDAFLGNPLMVRVRLEGRRRRCRKEITFFIENLLSWKHTYRMQYAISPNVYLFIIKEAWCLQPGIFKYKHYRQGAEAALCE